MFLFETERPFKKTSNICGKLIYLTISRYMGIIGKNNYSENTRVNANHKNQYPKEIISEKNKTRRKNTQWSNIPSNIEWVKSF